MCDNKSERAHRLFSQDGDSEGEMIHMVAEGREQRKGFHIHRYVVKKLTYVVLDALGYINP